MCHTCPTGDQRYQCMCLLQVIRSALKYQKRAQNLDWLGLRVAVQVKIADILAEHPTGLHTDKLGELVNIDSAKLSRIMRLLASKHVFRESTFFTKLYS